MADKRADGFHGAYRPDVGDSLDLTVDLPIFVIHSLIGVLIITVNVLFLLILVHDRSLRNTSSIIMMSLALADLGVGITTLSLLVYAIFSSSVKQLHCDIMAYCFHVSGNASLYTIMLLSMDRWVSIANPFRYPVICRLGVCIPSIIVTWIFSFGYWIFPLVGVGSFHVSQDELMCTFNVLKHPIKCILDTITLFLGPTVVTATCYYCIWAISCRLAKRLQNIVIPRVSTPKDEKMFATKKHPSPASRRALRTVVLIVGVFYLSWLPLVTLNVYEAVKGPEGGISPWLHTFIHVLAISNSLWNPIIYVRTNKLMRQATLRMLFKCCPLRLRARYFNRSSSGTYFFSLSGLESKRNLETSPSVTQVETSLLDKCQDVSVSGNKLTFRL